MKLDDYINKLNKPVSIIKIDTEGFEKEVIEGSKKFIAKNPKYLIVELQKDNNYRNYSPKLIEKLINELGYVKIFEKNGPLNLFKDCVYQILKSKDYEIIFLTNNLKFIIKKMNDNYQFNFSDSMPSMYESSIRIQKANKTINVLKDFLNDTSNLNLLDIGSSSGIMTNEYAKSFNNVIGIDLDAKAVNYANENFKEKNLKFICSPIEESNLPKIRLMWKLHVHRFMNMFLLIKKS